MWEDEACCSAWGLEFNLLLNNLVGPLFLLLFFFFFFFCPFFHVERRKMTTGRTWCCFIVVVFFFAFLILTKFQKTFPPGYSRKNVMLVDPSRKMLRRPHVVFCCGDPGSFPAGPFNLKKIAVLSVLTYVAISETYIYFRQIPQA